MSVVRRAPSRTWRIGIDVSWSEGQFNGTGVYTVELVQALLRQDQENQYYLYFRDPQSLGAALWRLDSPNVMKRTVGVRAINLRNQVLAYHLYRDGIDLFHSPAYFLPHAWAGKKLVTFHDVNYWRCLRHWLRPASLSPLLALSVQTPLSAWQSRMILTVSETSAKDIVRYYHVPAGKVQVIHSGVRPFLVPDLAPASVDEALARYGLRDYVLYVGVMAPQKNLERLIRAFARYASTHSGGMEGQPPLTLVLAGMDHGRYAEGVLQPLARDLGCGDRVIFTGFVSDHELHALYVGARCAVQISEGEGFGLPVVEAMACGTPVVAANSTATAEVAGDAALLVDPGDTEAIATALGHLQTDEPLRGELRRRGLLRAQQFSWDEAARRTLEAYYRVLYSS